jgi:hypothetical protein
MNKYPLTNVLFSCYVLIAILSIDRGDNILIKKIVYPLDLKAYSIGIHEQVTKKF